jgi:hypothetical protein
MRKFSMIAAAATLGLAAFAAAPASAQGWYGYGPGWHARDGYGPYGRWGDNNYGVDAGETDIAICPPRYHLGRDARLCWPD